MTTRVIVQCDQETHPGGACPVQEHVEADTAESARQILAIASGWSHTPERGDACPIHSGKLRIPRQRVNGDL